MLLRCNVKNVTMLSLSSTCDTYPAFRLRMALLICVCLDFESLTLPRTFVFQLGSAMADFGLGKSSFDDLLDKLKLVEGELQGEYFGGFYLPCIFTYSLLETSLHLCTLYV